VWLSQPHQVIGLQAIGCGQKNRPPDLEDEAFFGRRGLDLSMPCGIKMSRVTSEATQMIGFRGQERYDPVN
jgi:hypothetical protein